MIKKHGIIYIASFLVLLFCSGFFTHLLADSHRHRERNHGRGGENRFQNKNDFKPVTDTTYKFTCGGCHFPYPPELLPAASWGKIINQVDQHFGEQVPIDPSAKGVISKYLAENGADRSSAKKARKIVICLKGRSPLRITEIPYIQKKHRGIKPEVLNRKTIGSLSNCIACHKTAEQGNFDEDYVTIPK